MFKNSKKHHLSVRNSTLNLLPASVFAFGMKQLWPPWHLHLWPRHKEFSSLGIYNTWFFKRARSTIFQQEIPPWISSQHLFLNLGWIFFLPPRHELLERNNWKASLLHSIVIISFAFHGGMEQLSTVSSAWPARHHQITFASWPLQSHHSTT